MTLQTQCPNCGGFRVTNLENERVYSGAYNAVSRKERRTTILMLVVLTALMVVCCPLSVASDDFNALLILMGIGLVLTVLAWVFGLLRLRQGNPEIVGVIRSFECDLCGYKWTERPGQQKPNIQVRPDLIAAGEQRLREAEERRRREAEAYEAWRNQQNE